MKILLSIAIIVLLSSCLTDKRINKQIAKATPERVLGLIQKNYPHLFTTRVDTIRDTVMRSTIRVDTILTLRQLLTTDTVVITKDRLRIRMITRNDTIRLEGECVGDTIYIEKVITSVDPKKNFYKERWWSIPLTIVSLLFLLIILFYFGMWLDKKHKETNKPQ